MSVRIVTGTMSGRKLDVPDNTATRPTMDKTREAVFNSLRHRTPALHGATVIDVFAGTGAYGIEALSNGAAYVTFFESDGAAVRALKNNLKKICVTDITNVAEGSAANPTACRAKPATHAFFDPPYGKGLLIPVIAALTEKGWINGDTLLIIERERGKTREDPLPDNIEIIAEKTYGRAIITYARIGG